MADRDLHDQTGVTGLAGVVRDFAVSIGGPADLSELLHRLTDRACEVMPARGAGILVEDRSGDLQFAAASDDAVVELERHQQRIEAGACFEAYVSGTIVEVSDLDQDTRWPAYRTRALRAGLPAVLGMPVRVYDRTIGALNIYRDTPSDWSVEDRARGETLAALVAGYVLHAEHEVAQQELADNLQRAIDTRDLIGQAKGILIGRDGVDASDAFDTLRELSQRTNRKLRDVARDVVDGMTSD